jgi:hypothetical protein
MPKEPNAAAPQREKLSDTPRLMGGLTSKPRVLAPVEDSNEAAAAAPAQMPSGAVALVLPAANQVREAGGPSASLADFPLEPLRAARQAIEGLLAQTHDIHEQIWRAVESLLADLNAKLSRECAARIVEFEKDIRDRGHYQTSALLEQIDLEAEARMAARVDRALGQAEEAARRGSAALDEKLETSRASIASIASGVTEELQRLKASSLNDLQADAVKRLNDLKAQHESDFAVLAQKTIDALNDRLAKQADNRFQAFQERLKHLADDATGQAEIKLKALTEGTLARVTSDVQAVVTRETSTYLIDALRKRLDHLAGSLK